MQRAVESVQPFAVSSVFKATRSLISERLPAERYAATIIGRTISFAGNPKINAVRITPSSPKNLANGSRKPVICESSEKFPTEIFESSQMTSPAGAATAAALDKTKRVLSKTDLTTVRPTCGIRNGGSSRVKADGSPRRKVAERNFDAKSVAITPAQIAAESNAAEIKDEKGDETTANIVKTEISSGNRPLHGTKEFVKIAISFSLRDEIIRHPVTPTALQPNPIHIVRACFPHAPHFRKQLSRLKATRGRYPKSSSNVKRGKKIAIGGSITETTHESTL